MPSPHANEGRFHVVPNNWLDYAAPIEGAPSPLPIYQIPMEVSALDQPATYGPQLLHEHQSPHPNNHSGCSSIFLAVGGSYTVAGHLLVSHGVGLHCVQPEPYWRCDSYCRIYCSSNWCAIHVGSGTVTVIVLGKTTDSQGAG